MIRRIIAVWVLLAIFFPPSAFASFEYQRQLFGGGIYWYDPLSESSMCSPVYDVVGGSTEENTRSAFDFFVSRGLTADQSAGLVGNFLHETKGTMDPRITQGPGVIVDEPFDPNDNTGYGIAQWTTAGRKDRLQQFSGLSGKPVDSLELQLEFVWFELTGDPPFEGVVGGGYTTTYSKLKEMDAAEESAVLVHLEYEISAKAIEYLEAVSGFVQQYMSQKGGAKPTNEEILAHTKSTGIYQSAHGPRIDYAEEVMSRYGSLAGSQSCQYASADGLVGTILEYAHHNRIERRDPGSLTLKPAYEQAVKTARTEGRYTGGYAPYYGIDCGGFVSLAIQDSGHDPDYNVGPNGTMGGPVSAQKRYMDDSPIWQEIHPTSTADLQPGDVSVRTYNIANVETGGGHIFFYVGDVPGFEGKFASAWLHNVGEGANPGRVPSAYDYQVIDTRPPDAGSAGRATYWYRKV